MRQVIFKGQVSLDIRFIDYQATECKCTFLNISLGNLSKAKIVFLII